MLSISEQIMRLSELTLMANKEAYIAELRRIVDLINSRLPYDPLSKAPFPPVDVNVITQSSSDFSQMSRYSPLLQPIIENNLLDISSGDPDGAPAKYMQLIREELIGFHRQEIDRLGKELDLLINKKRAC